MVRGATATGSLLALAIENGGLSVLLVFAVVRRWRIGNGLFIFGSLVHASVLATVGLNLGPLLLLPVLLFGSLPTLMIAPIMRMPKTVFAVHALVFGVPLLLERFNVVRHTYRLVGETIILEPHVGIEASTLVVAVIAMIFLQLIGLSVVLDGMRKEQNRAQETVHLQSWQFAQLVRSSGSSS